ncbi:MAG: toxic anion resistance protein [Roseovarius sp.]|nr:toxic anion resistance protein [Roseovarius sp.]
MSDTTRREAAAALADVEAVSRALLPEPADADAIVPLDAADARLRAEIARRMAEIDLGDTRSIVGFGAAAQAELQEISQAMLQGVRNKDVGPAGDALRGIVSTIRGFSVSELDLRRERSWWEKLMGRAAPFADFTARFEKIQGQIDRITDDLLAHEHRLLKDIKSLDMLYEKTLAFYDELALYIAAGEAKLRELDDTDIPAREAAIQAAPAEEQVMKAQQLRDLRAARDDLERRVHDLRLTRQVTMQSLPSIRLVQENDKSLVTRINSTLVNTVPLWETQLAQAVTIQRSAEAAAAVRAAGDLTNELMAANAANLRESNKAIREEIERGAFDIEAVKKANADLIGTIEESLRIADEGKARRARAEAELGKMEAGLRDALAAASAHGDKLGDKLGETTADAVPGR